MEAARLAKTSRGSLSRSCRTPRVLMPKYFEVAPGIPSSSNPGATLGERLVSSWMTAFLELLAGAVIGLCTGLCKANRARNAHLIGQIAGCSALMQGIRAISCQYCKFLVTGLRSRYDPPSLPDPGYLRRKQ